MVERKEEIFMIRGSVVRKIPGWVTWDEVRLFKGDGRTRSTVYLHEERDGQDSGN